MTFAQRASNNDNRHVRTTDVAVIGAGTSGLAAYRTARAAGKRALLIEQGAGGTTCAREGCMPSKLLIAAADTAHAARHSTPFGIHIDGKVEVDGQKVMQRVRQERDRFVERVLGRAATIPSEDRLNGHARFIDDTTLLVGDDITVHANSIVIATGSSPAVPTSFHTLGDRVVVNRDVFEWHDLPRSVAVFGAGIIGLELGQALSRLGTHVRVFGANGSIAALTDPIIKKAVTACFNEEYYVDPYANVTDMQRDGDHVVITFTDRQGNETTEHFDYVLAATGRKPNLDGLSLERTGLRLDEQGVPLFDPLTLQCGQTPIFIAGDANGRLQQLHEASFEGKVAGENAAAFPDVRPVQRNSPISIVFSDPQIAMVGQRYSDLTPGSFVIGSMDFEDQGRSRVMLKNRGMMHIYADKHSGRFLGAEWASPSAEHIAHLLAWCHQQSLTIRQMLDMPVYHPVVEEGLVSALQQAEAARASE
ncbi:dihydrolipoyl dehydrogenase [Zymobacter palmae]|uniref:Pyruvate/2-oxoglutarate dehydrogenase complex n=1 Tax=Zymobacter palmae TaxID=33074 RepID=A0A348HC32_9GAMM|nr:dihydrolipoyl dehydrogenase [Zymobacter palmae]BBG29184.1 pyruvate/2-oxoglutarate dehydrogenase complex [Zymobacter palmae]